jgi:phosphoenolpyruvate-protein phosphotransferase
MPKLVLAAPLAGWVAPLDEVPDDVFAKRMIGDGVAIDPLGSTLFAPCDGTVVAMAAHAVTLRADGGSEILMHLGIDSVALAGAGFVAHVCQGQTVRTGDELISFDLEFLASRVKSLLSPIVVMNGNAFRIGSPRCGRSVAVGDPILDVISCAQAPEKADVGRTTASREIVCMLPNGLHARPAARLAGVAKACQSRICLTVRDRKADAASVAAQMALGLAFRDRVLISADGPDAKKALSAVVAVLASDGGETAAPVVSSAEVAGAVTDAANTTVCGTMAVPGLAIGRTRIWRLAAYDVPTDGRGVKAETHALTAALGEAKRQLRRSGASVQSEAGILAAHEALLDDPDLLRRATAEIAAGRSAGYAWRVAVRAAAEAMRSLKNVRLRARADDFADLEGQVLSQLTNAVPVTAALSPGTILLAETLYPSQLAALDSKKIAGIVTAGGGPTSHVALLAAAMNVPMLTGVGKALAAVPEGAEVVMDAEAGILDFAPTPERLDAVRKAMIAVASPETMASAECRTADGTRIEVFANLGGGANEAAAAVRAGAEGCGLLRSEFLFLDRATPPDEDEQYAHYQATVDAFAGRPVILRTFDIGADKPASYLPQPAEENPALGMRGIRLALRHTDMLCTQIRAAMRVRPSGRLKLMLPMVSDISELLTVRDLMMRVSTELSVASLPLGIMIETPAAAIMADKLSIRADFLSIGTNDLTQYAMAMDRIHPELAMQADGLHPAILRLIAQTVSGAKAIPVGVCGALAADPLAAAILIGLGVGELSVPVAALARLKRKIGTLTLSDCRVLADAALSCTTAGEVRAMASAVKDSKA